MSFARSYDNFPGLTELAALPGTVVVRITPQRNPLGAGFGTVCIVGEPTNDQGSNSAKTVVETVREITSADQLLNDYGQLSTNIGTSANGYEGNLHMALALPGIMFPRLLICAPDLEAGSVTFTRSAGGSAYVIPAASKVSDGSTGIFLTLEDVSFATSGSSQTGSARVRPLNSSVTSTVSAGDCDTIVSSLDASVTSVTNAADLVPPTFDTQYAAAIAATLGDTGLEGAIDVIVCRAHTAAIRTALITNVQAAALGRRARVAVYGPPVGTANATAIGSSGVGVGATSSRDKRLAYAYPGMQAVIPARGSSDPVDFASDIFVAHMIGISHPVENPGQWRDRAPYIVGLESGLDVAASKAQYATWVGLGIASPQLVDGYAEILADKTTYLTAPHDAISYVRAVDWLATSLHDAGAPWAKKLSTEKNRQRLNAEVVSMLETLKSSNNPEFQLIADYAVDSTSGNNATTRAAGLHIIKVYVQTLGSMNTIVFTLEAGASVNVTVSGQ